MLSAQDGVALERVMHPYPELSLPLDPIRQCCPHNSHAHTPCHTLSPPLTSTHTHSQSHTQRHTHSYTQTHLYTHNAYTHTHLYTYACVPSQKCDRSTGCPERCVEESRLAQAGVVCLPASLPDMAIGAQRGGTWVMYLPPCFKVENFFINIKAE